MNLFVQSFETDARALFGALPLTPAPTASCLFQKNGWLATAVSGTRARSAGQGRTPYARAGQAGPDRDDPGKGSINKGAQEKGTLRNCRRVGPGEPYTPGPPLTRWSVSARPLLVRPSDGALLTGECTHCTARSGVSECLSVRPCCPLAPHKVCSPRHPPSSSSSTPRPHLLASHLTNPHALSDAHSRNLATTPDSHSGSSQSPDQQVLV